MRIITDVAAEFTAPNDSGDIDLEPVVRRAEREARGILRNNWDRALEVADALMSP